MKTAPGTVDGTGHYVTEVGDTDEIRNTDNTKSYIGTSGRLKGKNPFTQYLTIFDGETGAALYTTDLFRMMRQKINIGATARQSITEVKDTLRQWLILTVFIQVSLCAEVIITTL